MHRRHGLRPAVAALTLLVLAVPAYAHYPVLTCSNPPPRSDTARVPALLVNGGDPGPNGAAWTILGCRYEANESVTVVGELQVGDGAPQSLGTRTVQADANGEFSVDFTYDHPVDVSGGYEFNVKATAEDGHVLTTGRRAIKSGGPSGLPNTGAGGTAGSDIPLPAGAGFVALGALVAIVLYRRRLPAR